MTTVNPTSVTTLLKTTYIPILTDLTFTNSFLFRGPIGAAGDMEGGLFPVYPKGTFGRTAPIKTAGRTAQNFVTGQPAPEAGRITYTSSTVVPEYIRGVLQIDNRVWDEIDGDNEVIGIIETETQDVVNSMQQMAHDIYLGSGGVAGNTGLLSVFDDTTDVFGVDRSTYTAHGSYVDDTTAALAYSDFPDMMRTLTDPDRAADENSMAIIAPSDQIDAYHDLAGPIAPAEAYKFVMPGGVLDLGFVGAAFRGRPIIKAPELDDGTILFVDMRDGWFQQRRPMTVEYKSTRDDTQEWHFTMALEFFHGNPQRCGKRENLTT